MSDEDSNTEYSRRQAVGGAAAEYRLFAAENDAPVRAGAEFLSNKTGMGNEIASAIVLALQQMLGFQNGAATMASSIQNPLATAGIRVGVGNGYSGSVSGSSIEQVLAAEQLRNGFQNRFFHSNGSARPEAMGLNQQEIGYTIEHLMRGGAGHQFGNILQREVMTDARLSELQVQARNMASRGDDSLAQELKTLRPGSIRFTEDIGMQAFEKYAERAAEVVSGIKRITDSQSLRELDSNIKLLTGGSLPEFGLDRAQTLVRHIDAGARQFFNGNTVEASAVAATGRDMIAGGLTGRLGLMPGSPEADSLEMLAANVNASQAFSGFEIEKSQMAVAAGLRGRGRSVRTLDAGTLQSKMSQDMAAYMSQEKEVAALSSIYGRGSDDDDKRIREALAAIGSSGNDAEVGRNRAAAGSLFAELAGTSVGSVAGTPEQLAHLLGSLRGDQMDVASNTYGNIRDTRMEASMKEAFRNDTFLARSTGMGRDDLGELGLGLSNLSESQYAALRKGASEGGDLSQIVKGDMASALREGGVTDIDRFARLAGSAGLDNMDRIQQARFGYRGLENFTGVGARREAEAESLRNLVATSLSGPPEARGDIVSEFIKGFNGDGEIRGGRLVGVAEGKGLAVNQIKLGKDGRILTDNGNLDALMGSDAGKAFLEKNKIADRSGLKKFLGQGASENEEALRALMGSGAFRIATDGDGAGTLKFLDTATREKAVEGLTEDANARILSGLAGKEALPRSVTHMREGEDKAAYEERIKRTSARLFREQVGKKGGIEGMVGTVFEEESFGQKVQASLGGLSPKQRATLHRATVDRIDDEITAFDKKYEDGEAPTEKEEAEFSGKLDNLMKLRDSLEKGFKGDLKKDMHVTTLHVGEVTGAGLGKK